MKNMLAMAMALMLCWQEMGAAQTSNAQNFVFKFAPEQPLKYAMQSRIEMDMDMSLPGQEETVNTLLSIDLRYNIKLTPLGKPSGNLSTLRLEPSDLEADWIISNPVGEVTINLRGADVTGTQNGVTTIDTKQGIGLDEAEQLKNDLAALYMPGEIDMDGRGTVTQIRGDSLFIKFWSESLQSQIGFFGVIFPTTPVAMGETWTESVTLKKMGEVQLEEPGLSCTARFVRQPDTTWDARAISRFNFEAPFSHKDLTGYMNQGARQMRASIPSFTRTAAGAISFDAQNGMLLESNAEVAADAQIAMNEGEETLTIAMTMGVTMNLRLLPNAPPAGK